MFKINTQESVKSIAARLKQKNLIRNDLIFYLYAKQQNLGEKIKAGTFILSKKNSVPQILEILTNTGKGEIKFLIPEGFTIKEIDQKLASLELINLGEFESYTKNQFQLISNDFLISEKNMEGFLFPDTYFINPNTFKVNDFAQRLINNFAKKALPEIKKQIGFSKRSLYEIIIMASIVEKEVHTDRDRPLIADILWRRLDNGWMLGADATILYLTSKKTITSTDLENESPYNTRKNKGLPPTPISNPGLKAIMATLNPQPNSYWYYLTPPNSTEVIYAMTNEEHNQNKKRYLSP